MLIFEWSGRKYTDYVASCHEWIEIWNRFSNTNPLIMDRDDNKVFEENLFGYRCLGTSKRTIDANNWELAIGNDDDYLTINCRLSDYPTFIFHLTVIASSKSFSDLFVTLMAITQ